jgi:hypothetical protein
MDGWLTMIMKTESRLLIEDDSWLTLNGSTRFYGNRYGARRLSKAISVESIPISLIIGLSRIIPPRQDLIDTVARMKHKFETNKD